MPCMSVTTCLLLAASLPVYPLCVPSLAAGETELHGQFDITKVDLHPSEQYKSVSHHHVVVITK